MKKLTAEQKSFKVNLVTENDTIYVGFDVHKRTYAAAVWCNGLIVRVTTMPADNEKVIKFLEPMRWAIKTVVYEAGPTGYTLARVLESAGYEVGVAAPSKTPSVKGDKSDRLDCRQLALYAAGGMLTYVSIPTIDQELDRQVRRMREQLNNKLKRVKQQIKSTLLQYGIAEPAGLCDWSKKSVSALKQVQVDERLRYCLGGLLDEMEYLESKLAEVGNKIKDIFGRGEHEAIVRRLDDHKCIDILTASHLAAELYDPRRFSNGREVAKYLGLSPRVRQSGQTRREGPLSRTGRGALRANLVQISWMLIRYDTDAKRLFLRLLNTTGHKNKAIAAVARRLGIKLWREMCNAAA